MMTATLLYDYFGGLTAVVISDAIQLALLLSAVVFSLIYIGDLIEWNFFVEERKQTLVNDWGFSGQDYGFWPMLIGGIFLYAAYYGCDQSQAQRILATSSEADTARVLLWNGIFRFPIVLLYCFLGLGLAALAAQDPLILGSLPTTSSGEKNLNVVFPVFVLNYFEPGFVGLVMVGLIAASMSSIDSALNSLPPLPLKTSSVRVYQNTHRRRGCSCWQSLHNTVGLVCGCLRFSGRKHRADGSGGRKQSRLHGKRAITRPHRIGNRVETRIPNPRAHPGLLPVCWSTCWSPSTYPTSLGCGGMSSASV